MQDGIGTPSNRHPSNDILMVALSRYYSQKGNVARLLPFINGKSTISLRLIDWFVTNYAKKHNTVIAQTMNGNLMHLNVYLSYRAQIKAYSKQQFDPFRRRDRVIFYYDVDKSIETTVGQLNFFRWMLQNNIIDYVTSNAKHIEDDMIIGQKHRVNGKGDTEESGGEDEMEDPQWDSKPPPPVSMPKSRKARTDAQQCKVTTNMTRLVGERTISFE